MSAAQPKIPSRHVRPEKLVDVPRSPDDVTRLIFAALSEAGLRPVGVCGCRLADRPAAEAGARA